MRFPLWARLRVVFFLSSVVGGCPFEEFEAFFHLPPIVTFIPFIVSGPLAATEEIKPQDAHIYLGFSIWILLLIPVSEYKQNKFISVKRHATVIINYLLVSHLIGIL